MPRPPRANIANIIYHVINRANGRLGIFSKDKDYQAFLDTLKEVKDKFPVEVLAFCIMPNHWHILLKPLENGALSRFMGWLTMTHTQRWHAAHHTVGSGHLYQGRYKSFPVETDEYFLQLARYIERNPVRAKLVKKAQDWQWSSLWIREKKGMDKDELLSPWPIPPGRTYLSLVNTVQDKTEVDTIRKSIYKNRPLGSESWVKQTAKVLDLESSLREPGRPRRNGC